MTIENTIKKISEAERNRELPFQIYPEDLVCFAIRKVLHKGRKNISPEEITAYIPPLSEARTEDDNQVFTMMYFSYRPTPRNHNSFGHHSSSVNNYFQFLCSAELTINYHREDFLITKNGAQYCRDVVENFYQNSFEAAKALANALDTSCENLLF